MSVKIGFEFVTKYGVFRDALVLPKNHNYTQEQIESLKSERLNSWIYSIENPVEADVEDSEYSEEDTTS